MSKKNKMRHDINNYNLRFNVKKEELISINPDNLRDWYKLNKKFRYKKRISYKTKDGLQSNRFNTSYNIFEGDNLQNHSLMLKKKKKRH